MEPLPPAVKEFVGAARVCRIATVRPDRTPHVIPVCPVFDGDATVYVDIGRRYTTTEALNKNASVAVLIDEYDDDWDRLRAVLLRCRAEPIRGPEKERAWELIRTKFPQYKEIGWEPRLTLALRVQDWRQWGIV
ncbi:MAG TPA: pyridoxamine 5'-phosphate oxidase family protein [Dehalococcoidia bacterium]|nr:pyridoxamine 5'-phosphate oxidase family protein [Dehalococcoidia bacterium]